MTLSTWTTEQGLPQDFITALDQTPDGFLWIGTKGGLARFDGQTFRTSFSNEPAAIHSSVSGIGHDTTGRLWAATSLGLLCYQNGLWSQLALPGKASAQPDRLLVTHDDSLLLVVGGQVWRLGSGTHEFVRLPDTPEKVRSLAEDRNGTLWLADNEAVTRRSPTGETLRYPLQEAALVVAASNGQVYAGDGHHIFRFDGQAFTPVPNAGTEEFVDLRVAHDGALWMAAGGLEGISRKTAEGVERLGRVDGLASNDVRTLFEDRDGAMWVGTIAGLQRLRSASFTTYSLHDGLPPHTAQYDALFVAADQSIWTGTLEDGISGFRKDQWTTFGEKAGVRRGQVRGFAEDGPMPLVAIADYGLFRWDGRRYAPMRGIPPGYVTSPVRMQDGSVWFSIIRQGVFRWQNGSSKHFGAAEGLSESTVWCLLPDGSGGMWAGTRSGLFHLSGDRWTRVHPELNDTVVTLTRTSSGALLGGTSTGLFSLRGDRIRTAGHAQGLLTVPVLQIVEDKEYSLWLATPGGLYRVTQAHLERAMDGGMASLSPERFNEGDGLPGRDFLPMSHVLGQQASNGRLWFALTRGPASGTYRQESAPQVVMDETTVDGVAQTAGTVHVRPGRHRLTFAFTAPSFYAPEQIRFRYRLVGWDSAWVDAGRQREASYAGLPPGRYSFEVQAIGRGEREGPLAQIPLVDLQPFLWQTRWFLLLACLLTTAAVVELTRRRTLLRARRLSTQFQQRAAERERIAYEIHDTVIQDLIGATLYLEIAEMEMAAGDVDKSQPLEGLAARLRETIARSRNMVANLHSTALPDYGLLDVLRLAEAEFRLAVHPAFKVTYTGEPHDIDLLLRDEVYRICREAIANAFRHAQAQHIEVRAHFERHSLVIEIADDGVGMDATLRQRGRAGHFGVPAMRAHSERIGASFSIVSAPGNGTTVRLMTRSSWRTRVWTHMQDITSKLRTQTRPPHRPHRDRA